MKKIIFLITLLGFIINSGFAQLKVEAAGVGIGNDAMTPVEKLEVFGGLKIGTTSNANAGTMRWTGTDFEGYDGSIWKSLTSSAAGVLTINGESEVYFNSGNVGIGLSNPAAPLDVGGNAIFRGTQFGIGKGVGSTSIDLKIGEARTENGIAGFALVGDVLTYPSYGFRFLRYPNGQTVMIHRGTNSFVINAQEAAVINFQTSNAKRLTIDAGGEIGINNPFPTEQLDVIGNIKYSGSIMQASDKRLKKNIKDYSAGLEQILRINPVFFSYNGRAGTNDKRSHIGIVAQDLQKVLPELVSEFTYKRENEKEEIVEETNYLQINDSAIKYVLINAIKAQQELISLQEEKINSLESRLSHLEKNLILINIKDDLKKESKIQSEGN